MRVSRGERILLRVEEELVELKTQLNEIMNELMTLFRQSSAKDRLRILNEDTLSLSSASFLSPECSRENLE